MYAFIKRFKKKMFLFTLLWDIIKRDMRTV